MPRAVKVFYCDQFVLPLPEGHRFPMAKYARLRAKVATHNRGRFQLCVPPAAADDELHLAHDDHYITRVTTGALSPREQRVLGFPWSKALVERSRRSVGATIAACRAALAEGVAVNLAGGTHHAYRDQAQGFCVFNDAAVAARVALDRGWLPADGKVAIVDADVHQGNGTAAILGRDPRVFTFSIHGGRNFPFRKEQSDLDVALDDGTDDHTYLQAFADALPTALAGASLAIYLAGADPFQGDRLGRLALTKAGLARRDQLLFAHCAAKGIPVAVAMAGGYALDIDDIVAIHFHTVAAAARWAPRLPKAP